MAERQRPDGDTAVVVPKTKAEKETAGTAAAETASTTSVPRVPAASSGAKAPAQAKPATAPAPAPAPAASDEETRPDNQGGAQIFSLDQFRKK